MRQHRNGRPINRRRTSGRGRALPALIMVLCGFLLFWLWRHLQPVPSPPAPTPIPVPPTFEHLSAAVRQPPAKPPATSATSLRRAAAPHGSVAIIVDDMGSSMHELRELMDIGVPLTFAVIPGLAHSAEVGREAHANGYPVMVHMPMEPTSGRRIEANGLLVRMSEGEIGERVAEYLRELPLAGGSNNHMGSLFTERREKMETVVRVLRENGLFFIDSRTSPASTAEDAARAGGVKTASRDVFLDNVRDTEAIIRQLREAVLLAGKKGKAIAICHPYPETRQALARILPRLQREGVAFVPAGAMVN